MANRTEIDTLLNEYRRHVAAGWEAAPAYEGDLLAIAGVRDELHDIYLQLTNTKKREEVREYIRRIDESWQTRIRATQTPDFRSDYKETAGNHWWYRLDKLDDPTVDPTEI